MLPSPLVLYGCNFMVVTKPIHVHTHSGSGTPVALHCSLIVSSVSKYLSKSSPPSGLPTTLGGRRTEMYRQFDHHGHLNCPVANETGTLPGV